MENITLVELAGFMGVITVIVTFIIKAVQPFTTITARITKIESHQDKDLKRFEKYDRDLQQVLLSVNVLLSHSIDNNHTQQLKDRKNELDEYLIKRT